MNRRAYIGYLLGVVAIASALLGIHDRVYAQDVSFARGQKLNHFLSVCLDKDVAISILNADAKDGIEAARAVWESSDRCQSVPVMGPVVGKVVKSAKVKRGDSTVTARVVEILADGKVIGYFFTTATVDERNS